MRSIQLLPLLLLAGLVACSGEEPTSSFSDPVAAMDQADAASAAGNHTTAEEGYAYAIEHGDAKLQGDALLALLNLHLGAGNDAGAESTFQRLAADFADRLDSASVLGLCNTAATERMVGVGEMMVAYGAEHCPDITEDLKRPSQAFEILRTQGPGGDLSGLGYAGD